jgi:hypothetical protein
MTSANDQAVLIALPDENKKNDTNRNYRKLNVLSFIVQNSEVIAAD